MGQQFLVVGPGWLGSKVAESLRDGEAEVWTLQRSATVASPSASVHPLQGDIRSMGDEGAASPNWLRALPPRLDGVVVCVAPSRAAGDSHEQTYPAAVRGAIRLAADRACPRVLYTSSTGVYGRTDGGYSTEQDVIRVTDARQGALRDAELALNYRSSDHHSDIADDRTIDRVILRVAGLYGPGRDPAPRFRTAIPAGDADVWCNFAWRDDVVAAIVRLMVSASEVHATTRIFNCADGVPLRASTIARALGAAQPSSNVTSSRATAPSGRSHQRITVDALRTQGWAPSMRTVFDGLEALGHRDILRPAPHSADADSVGEPRVIESEPLTEPLAEPQG